MPVTDLSNPPMMPRPVPTSQRPLLGQTVLLVEDSRYASEAVRLLALRSGARIRRADCIASAERHLGTYRAGIAIVDLGLPDGDGLTLIRTLANAKQRPAALLATSGQARAEVESEAMAAGADGFLAKPIESLAAFQHAILKHLPVEEHPKGPRALPGDTVEPDPLALSEDLVYAERMLADESIAPAYVANFLAGLARTKNDADFLAETETLAASNVDDLRPQLRNLIARRLGARRIV